MNSLAPLSKRVYALLIDTVLIAAVIFTAPVFDIFGIVYAVLAVLMLFVYEPLCVSTWGQTLGHKLIGIKVVDEDGKNPSIGQAVGRWLVKAILGLWSFITMLANGNTVHDIVTKTKVLVVEPEMT